MRHAIALCSLALIAACRETAPPPEPSDAGDPLPDGGGCSTNSDCSPDTVCRVAACVDGACVPFADAGPDGVICWGEVDASICGRCDRGTCAISECSPMPCDLDCHDCPTGAPCIGGLCVNDGVAAACCAPGSCLIHPDGSTVVACGACQ